ncbi:MAG: hypothetical protein J6J27_02930 [Alphaproteobacteria bacterium]|nr:hypothetical protein [Alphaproteobacteria bacterium]
MKKLGLDLGTNSIGWGIIDTNNTEKPIQNCGVYIFPEGVKIEKGVESSKASERTGYRSARRLKFRRKLRKYETLKVLIEYNMCPLTVEELEKWRKEKIYPTSQEFINWYRTDELNNWEPYFLRKKCVEEIAEKYEIGRALYHIAQRRGFLSNRKESTKGNEDGAVQGGISEITNQKGDKTLGQYFYELKQSGEKVRARYTSRKEHYEEEFNKICTVQNISEELKAKLYNAIFFQRKLKSQKFLVGKCTFERNKSRCPISHFEFEEFRMLQFINSIRVKRNEDETDDKDFAELLEFEREILIKDLFLKKTKPFTFKDIKSKLCSKKHEDWEFNYIDETNIAGCPVSTSLKEIFGENWKDVKIGNYDINDIWHVLYDFDDDDKLKEFAEEKLHLSEDDVKKFCKITLQQGYSNLSLKAIRKILPFLREGLLYSYAAFLANVPKMIGEEVFAENKNTIIDSVKNISSSIGIINLPLRLANDCLDKIAKDKNFDFRTEDWNKEFIDTCIKESYGQKKWEKDFSQPEQEKIKSEIENNVNEALKTIPTGTHLSINNFKYPMKHIDELIEEYLRENFEIKKNITLYHPSYTDSKYDIKPAKIINGKKYLDTPKTSSIKNPVVMRALHQLRKLINYLLKTGEIDENTHIHIELAKEVNDKNWRKAIADFQKDNEAKNKEYRERIEYEAKANGISLIVTDELIKKYRLWVEQDKQCPYTGKKINFTALFGNNPQFDFEHTIPRSLSYDDSLENLTLCDVDFNRNVKKQQIPHQLANYKEIAQRFERYYEEKIDDCLTRIEKSRTHGRYIDPSIKDAMIVKRHKAELELRYYIGKLKRFNSEDVTKRFKHSQLNDTRTITKFAKDYLKTVFDYVMPINGTITDTFKHQWGLLEKDEKKDRSTNLHHVVDALVVASVDKWKYDLLCKCIHESSDGRTINLPKPWENFRNDVLSATELIIPKIVSSDNALKQTKKIIRDRYGKPKLNKDGQIQYVQGDTARGSLHKDTFYGCIMTPPEKDKPSEKIYVQTISCSALDKSKAEKIIDKGIKRAFFDNLDKKIQTLPDIQRDGIKLPYQINNRDVYAKKVRIAAHISNPIELKKQKDVSKKEYKQSYYVQNEENYFIALYRYTTEKGKIISDYIVSNLLNSVKNKQTGDVLYPLKIEKNGFVLSLYKVLKIGQIVIFQEYENEDVLSFPKDKLFSRIYRVAGIASKPDGRVNFVHVIIPGAFIKSKEQFPNGIEKYKRVSNSNLFILVEGKDFKISPTGEIIKL